MICVQEIEGKDRLGPKDRCGEPTEPQQLAKMFQIRGVRTGAESATDRMVAGKVDNKDLFDFRAHWTNVTGMAEVDDEPKTFEGNIFKETTIPRLGNWLF